ncbi:hypothetical protein IMSAGC012_01568 [Lachnospiraceae bacterium]|nr:hypothetical protein IMSAGC012_01568 [Lachnospiraceae bacterium]
MLGLAQNEQKYDEDAEELKMIFQKNKELLERLEYQFCFMEERGQDKKSFSTIKTPYGIYEDF